MESTATVATTATTGPTYGERLVRTAFNPSASDAVTRLKNAAAAFIDLARAEGKDPRTAALAVTACEEAAMWAVKSATA